MSKYKSNSLDDLDINKLKQTISEQEYKIQMLEKRIKKTEHELCSTLKQLSETKVNLAHQYSTVAEINEKMSDVQFENLELQCNKDEKERELNITKKDLEFKSVDYDILKHLSEDIALELEVIAAKIKELIFK